MAKHKCEWQVYHKPAIGYWQKRDCPGDGIYFNGRVEVCFSSSCWHLRFICDDPRYEIVEVEKPCGL